MNKSKEEKPINWEERRYELTLKLLDILPYYNGMPITNHIDEVVEASNYLIKRLKEEV